MNYAFAFLSVLFISTLPAFADCGPQNGKGTDDDEVLYFKDKETNEYFHFVCGDNICGDKTYIAILGTGHIQYKDKSAENHWFKCGTAPLNDAWYIGDELPKCETSGNDYFIKNLDNSHRVIIDPNKKIYDKGYYIKFYGYSDVCIAYACDQNYKFHNDECKEKICKSGETRTVPDCDDIPNASQCTQECIDEVEWKFKSLDACTTGYHPDGNVCVADKKTGACKTEDLPVFATAGQYMPNEKCAATKCKSGTYLVVKNGASQGWCVAATYCQNKKDPLSDDYKLKIIDGDKTDLSCEQQQKATVATENKPTDTTVTDTNQTNSENTENNQDETVAKTETDTTVTDTNQTVSQNTENNQDETVANTGTDTASENNDKAKTNTDATGVTAQANNNTQNNKPRLTEEQSKQRISELQENAQKMRDKETSTANKLLGAAGIGATGIGGMQVASALAEQNADADAETAMRAYLATFHCNYGDGKNIAGGTKNVEIPGGNELIGLYSEYVNLANNLKMRKTALGLRPGIESEPILDSATSGLYDDVSTGITSGAYASLARALQNPDGPDAIAWAAQKDKTADKLKTGAIVAGVGALGSLAGNLAINSGAKNRERSAEINAKYDALKQVFVAFEQEINNITPEPQKCSQFSGTTGTGNAPNCTCKNTNERFFADRDGCVACPTNMTYNNSNECVCITGYHDENGTCVLDRPDCNLSGLKTDKCECIENATAQNNICTCTDGYYDKNGKCEKVKNLEDGEEIYSKKFNSDQLFISGKSTLTDKAKAAIKDLITNINKNTQAKEVIQSGSYCITITGHTDRTKFRPGSSMNNQKLSENRANAVKNELISASNPLFSENNITTSGKAESECTTDKYPLPNDAQCRRVDIVINVGKCGDQPSQSTAGTKAVTSSAASNELKWPEVDEKTCQDRVDDAKRNEITPENTDTALENILNDHNIEPTDELKKQWRTYAKKCHADNGILTLTKFVRYDGYKATYYAECIFTDCTTLTKKDYDKRMNDMGANWTSVGVIMKLHITMDDKAILIK